MAFTTGKKGIKMMIKRISLIAGMMCLLAADGYAEEKIKHLSIKPVPAITKDLVIYFSVDFETKDKKII